MGSRIQRDAVAVTGRLPHPIPYQGSKRKLAPEILDLLPRDEFDAFFEPFAGSAALAIAARARNVAKRYVIGDALAPLIGIWQLILDDPDGLADRYEDIWLGLDKGGPEHFNRVRAAYNSDGDPAKLLYLLARCVKNAPRFNRSGAFSQSADHRRKGMRPSKMREEIGGANRLLAGVCETAAGDARQTLEAATPRDIVYMDPPWQGTTEGTDKRYVSGFPRVEFEELLADLNERGVPWIISYDGRSGEKVYGERLPAELYGSHHELAAGRSAQATLNGDDQVTIESLYLSPGLAGSRSTKSRLE